MAALRSLSFCLLAVGLLLPAAAFIRQTITAEAGQDSVTLTCGAGKEKNIRAVECSRAVLRPDVIFLYRDGHFDSEGQHPSFRNRVDLQDRQMKDGDVSLVLKDVTINDTGTYECRVIKGEGGLELMSSIHLEVSSPPGTPEGGANQARGDKEGGGEEGGGSLGLTVGLPVSLLCVLVGVAAWIYYRKPACLQRNSKHLQVDQTEPKPV